MGAHACTRTHMHIHAHATHAHTHSHTCRWTHAHAHMRTRTQSHMQMDAHTHTQHSHVCTHAHLHTWACTHAHTCALPVTVVSQSRGSSLRSGVGRLVPRALPRLPVSPGVLGASLRTPPHLHVASAPGLLSLDPAMSCWLIKAGFSPIPREIRICFRRYRHAKKKWKSSETQAPESDTCSVVKPPHPQFLPLVYALLPARSRVLRLFWLSPPFARVLCELPKTVSIAGVHAALGSWETCPLVQAPLWCGRSGCWQVLGEFRESSRWWCFTAQLLRWSPRA